MNSVGELSFKNVIFSEEESNYSSIIEKIDYLDSRSGKVDDESVSINKLDTNLQDLFDYNYETLTNT